MVTCFVVLLGVAALALQAVSFVKLAAQNRELQDFSLPSSTIHRRTSIPPIQVTYPRLVWLMSFPNSGTSYTMRLVKRTSYTTAATNYYRESLSSEIRPVYSDSPEGPFWLDPDESKYRRRPTRYLLTKTHCGSRCSECAPDKYMNDANNFPTLCAGVKKLQKMEDGTETSVTISYNTSKVHKAIHLIRDPFANIVSRFHHTKKRMNRNNDTKELEMFPDNKEGFRRFCLIANEKWKNEVNNTWFSDEISMLLHIPCRDDFLRYAVWHNLAFMATDEDLHLPTLVVHYEDYAERFNETVTELLAFLDLEKAAEPYPFHNGRAYDDYFTKEERKTVKEAMKVIATKQTWQSIKHYFN